MSFEPTTQILQKAKGASRVVREARSRTGACIEHDRADITLRVSQVLSHWTHSAFHRVNVTGEKSDAPPVRFDKIT